MAVSDEVQTTRAFGDRSRGIRDFLLSSRRFQRWAAAFPLTRPIARRRASELFDLCAGFVYSQVLVACVRLNLFARLQDGPQSPALLASQDFMPIDSMATLLDAAASLRLLERRSGGRYGLGPLGAALLGNPGIEAMVDHHAALYSDLADPVALLRGEITDRRLSQYWPYAAEAASPALSREDVSPYTALMAASQPMVSDVVLSAYPFANHRCLLDIGGGDGSFLIAVGKIATRLQLQLLDLPEVAAIARTKLSAAGLGARVSVTGGHFLREPLPVGADVVSLIRVVHDHDDHVVAQLFRRIHEVLPADGVLVVGEPMSAATGGDAVSAYFGMYLHAMGSGRPRSFVALRELLRSAGFAAVEARRSRIPLISSVVIARR